MLAEWALETGTKKKGEDDEEEEEPRTKRKMRN